MLSVVLKYESYCPPVQFPLPEPEMANTDFTLHNIIINTIAIANVLFIFFKFIILFTLFPPIKKEQVYLLALILFLLNFYILPVIHV